MMSANVVSLPNMAWRKRRMLKNATDLFLRSAELAEVRARHKAKINRDIEALFGDLPERLRPDA